MMPPLDWMMDSRNTFYLRDRNLVLYVFSIYKTNSKIMWIENLIRNPGVKGSYSLMRKIVKFIIQKAEDKKIKALFAMSMSPRTSLLFKKLGFTCAVESLSTFVRRI